jgi:hypothetical protein
VKAAAYAHAEGSGESLEIALGNLINRFGVEAILGKSVLSVNEIKRIQSAEIIERLYIQRQASTNWAAWASANKEQAEILAEAMIAAVDEGMIEDG